MRAFLASFLAEMRAEEPPRRLPRDGMVAAAMVVGLVLEATLRTQMTWRPLAIAFGVCLVALVAIRRQHPLAAAVAGFGGLSVLDVAAYTSTGEPLELYSAAWVLLLVYSLFRWGSGREAVIGLTVMLTTMVTSQITAYSGPADLIGGFFILMFPAALAMSIRHQKTVGSQRRAEAKLREREQLARELHDSVAHHVSAIAIQAQAGLFLARSSSLEGAVDALEVIEEEASRTLAEMRGIVATLRDADVPADMTPQQGAADIERLGGRAGGRGPFVEVETDGDIDDLSPSVGAALYRIAQESITNARRHARNATRVRVCLRVDDQQAELTVTDDGDPAPAGGRPGFGLLGMTERAALLGGSLDAGPGRERGWTVHALVPRVEARR